MTKEEAHRILDNARAGCLITEQLITEALGVTGDLATRHAVEQKNPTLEAPVVVVMA